MQDMGVKDTSNMIFFLLSQLIDKAKRMNKVKTRLSRERTFRFNTFKLIIIGFISFPFHFI